MSFFFFFFLMMYIFVHSLSSNLPFCSNVKRKPSTNAQRVATARKNLKNRIDTDGTPPRSALTMFDLIFYNPSKNPMKYVFHHKFSYLDNKYQVLKFDYNKHFCIVLDRLVPRQINPDAD